MKLKQFWAIFTIFAFCFGGLGALIGAWLSMAVPDSIAENVIKGGLVGLILAFLLSFALSRAKDENGEAILESEPLEADPGQENSERKRALSYQKKIDYPMSALKTAGAVFLVAIAFSVIGSNDHRSPLFFLLVAYPAIALANFLLFRSWGWVGRIFVLSLMPLVGIVGGLWVLFDQSITNQWAGILFIALGIYSTVDSVQKYKKIKELIAKYPASNTPAE